MPLMDYDETRTFEKADEARELSKKKKKPKRKDYPKGIEGSREFARDLRKWKEENPKKKKKE